MVLRADDHTLAGHGVVWPRPAALVLQVVAVVVFEARFRPELYELEKAHKFAATPLLTVTPDVRADSTRSRAPYPLEVKLRLHALPGGPLAHRRSHDALFTGARIVLYYSELQIIPELALHCLETSWPDRFFHPLPAEVRLDAVELLGPVGELPLVRVLEDFDPLSAGVGFGGGADVLPLIGHDHLAKSSAISVFRWRFDLSIVPIARN